MTENERRPRYFSDLENPGLLLEAEFGGMVHGDSGEEHFLIRILSTPDGAIGSESVLTLVVPRDRFQPLLEAFEEALRTIPPRLFA
ncbi:MAG: hypothetical protein OXE02_08730 [Chloroflexi bacterium]|nr:hypothetical protein [Chloroflexota bacterium]